MHRDFSSNLEYYYQHKVQVTEEEKADVEFIVKEVIIKLVQYISEEDKRFSNNFRVVGSCAQGLKVGRPDEVDINIPLLLLHEEHFYGQWGPPGIYRERFYDLKRGPLFSYKNLGRVTKEHRFAAFAGDIPYVAWLWCRNSRKVLTKLHIMCTLYVQTSNL